MIAKAFSQTRDECIMTDLQFRSILLMVRSILKGKESIEDAIKEIDTVLKGKLDNEDE